MTPLLLTGLCLVASLSLVSGNNVQKLARAELGFSQDLYQEVAVNSPNVIYSPASVHMIMAMMSLGARNVTLKEILQTLRIGNFTGDSAHVTYRNLITQLTSINSVIMRKVNAIFINPSRQIEPSFISDIAKYYSGNASNFDLTAAGGPEKAINDFVAEATNYKIIDLLSPGTINPDTLAVVVNAIYLNASWQLPFLKDNTKQGNFTKADGTIVKKDMMYNEINIKIALNYDGADVAELLLHGGNYSFVIILPKTHNGLPAIENWLTIPGKVEQMLSQLQNARVNVTLPKFNIMSKFTLNQALTEMGMPTAFDRDLANFQGIAPNAFIDKAIHQAVMEVNEDGIVAAAATAVVVSVTSLPPPANVAFKVDHPFIAFVKHNPSNYILFQVKLSE